MKLISKAAAALSLAVLFGCTAVQAQVPAAAPVPAGKTAVKSSVRHLKNGKVVPVKAYTRTVKPKKVAVKASVRHLKNGKVVPVKAYSRKAAPKKPSKKM